LSRCDTPKPETLSTVPNQPKTPVRTFRLADGSWQKLKALAKTEGFRDTSALIRHIIEDYLRGKK
jgi:hypothetical protein